MQVMTPYMSSFCGLRNRRKGWMKKGEPVVYDMIHSEGI